MLENNQQEDELPEPKTEDLPIPSPKFEYRTIKINDIQLEVADPRDIPDTEKRTLRENESNVFTIGGKQIQRVLIGGEPLAPTGRFWTSLYSRFGLSTSFFKYFSHDELFKRIAERENNNQVRVTIERGATPEDSRLLAATGLNKPIVLYDDLKDILTKFDANHAIRYYNGMMVSTHSPRSAQSQFKIGGDQFSNRYELHCPIDGFGQPAVYLSLLRWICSNGAVGYANAFKTSLVLGGGQDNTRYAIQRALDSFTNDDGYAIMRSRFETATRSWASIQEQQSLYQVLYKLQNDPVLKDCIQDWGKTTKDEASLGVANSLFKAFDRCAGNPFDIYRADPHMMSGKRQRTLPVACKVYDLINFATELATHHVSEAGARQLQGWIGQLLSNDYDLEDSAEGFSSWKDMFLANSFDKKK